MKEKILNEIKRVKSIADIGLLFSSDAYDRERYMELKELSLSLMSSFSGHSIDALRDTFPLVADYPTAKVDLRGIILSQDRKILLVKESSDGKWSLPGGWADIGKSPKEVVVKEVKEESGIDVVPKALLAVFDKRLHPHPSESGYVYKMVFYCEAISSSIEKGFDILDVQYFGIDNLPPLSENRILKSQIEIVYQKIINTNFEAYFD